MKNNIRRNRNIGTAKQGYGQNNKMKIPDRWYKNDMRNNLERLNNYRKEKYIINEHEFLFIVEETLEGYKHACSVQDVAYLLQFIQKDDYGDLRYIIFRQPTRKEAGLEPVWGRLAYSFEFENNYYPAIILESYPIEGKLTWPKSLKVNAKREFLRLEKDGFYFEINKKGYEAKMTAENVRNTQLYRTFFHELGHYIHYQDIVSRPALEDEEYEEYEEWEKRLEYYHNSIPSSKKEIFAHNYADKFYEKLILQGVIPFDRKENEL